MKIKVCGMRVSENIRSLVALKPDYIGFIFYPKSKRYAAGVLDLALARDIPLATRKVGVFVDASYQTMVDLVAQYDLQAVQLHGAESPALCLRMKESGVEVIKAFSVVTPEDLDKTMAYNDVCDYFLFDTRCEGFGGSGRKFDWQLLSGYTGSRPLFLSGGIDAGDEASILELSKKVSIEAVDINSRFEVAEGVKDIEKVRRFMNTLRNKQGHII